MSFQYTASTKSQYVPALSPVLRTNSQALDGAVRTAFEPRFGHDFSRVRVHTDAQAARNAREQNALAYNGSNFPPVKRWGLLGLGR